MISTSPPVIPAKSSASGHSVVSANTDRRLPPSSGRSTTTYHFPNADDTNETVQADDVPLSYIHVPTSGQRGSSSSSSSSALSSFSKQAKVALSTIGSPPRRISCCDDNAIASPMVARMGNTGLLNTSSPPAIFRLEPKFRNNAKCMFTPRSDCGATSGRGRKRTAQSLSYYNNNTSHSANVTAASRGNLSAQGGNRGLTPVTARRVDATAFNFQGLSLRSPGSASTATFENSSLNQSAIDFRISATSPAATHSSFTVCGSSSFSKVCHANHSPAASNDETSFRHYRSGSFGSVVAQSPSCEMPPPLHVEISSSSPRIVPLTVLTHDSIPACSASTGNRLDIGRSASGSSVVGARSLLSHGFANGKSPLILPVDSSSTSDEGTSRGGETNHLSAVYKNDHAFRNEDYQMMMMIGTPQRPLPPLTSVQYCPDSAVSNMSMMHDSPVAAASHVFRTAAIVGSDKSFSRNSPSVVRTPLPKISLTPRSGASPNRSAAPFPEFPSPSPELGQQYAPIIWPKSSNTLSSSSSLASRRQGLTSLLLDDVAPEPQTTTVLDESFSLDLSMDPSTSSKIKNASNDSDKQISKDSFIPFPSWGHPPRSKPPKPLLVDTVPHDSFFPSMSKGTDVLNATAESTPTAPTRGSLKDIVVEVGGGTSENRQNCADTETLSDVDDDDFFLAIPSTLAEEKQELASCVEGTMRQTKQPRLNHHGTTASVNSTSDWIEHIDRRRTSMTSCESNSSLLGTGFALSSTSLRGMDTSSNPNLFGMMPNAEFMEQNVRRRASITSFESNSSLLGTGFALSSTSLRGMDSSSNVNLFGMMSKVHVQQGSIACLTTGPHAIGEGMKRDTSMASIGLDLDPEVCLSSKSDNQEEVCFEGPAGRDLVTPPVMAPARHPPPLSPRFGSLKNESTSARNDECFDSVKRTLG
jgi:hypothetical protein